MRHFNYFENGGPAPSSCLSCGRNNTLFDLGRELQFGGMAQLCLTCAKEIAIFIGFAEKAPLEKTIEELRKEIVSRETELAKVPDQVEELINGIRHSVTDFVFAVSYSSNDAGLETDESVDRPSNSSSSDREAAQRNHKASVKPARK